MSPCPLPPLPFGGALATSILPGGPGLQQQQQQQVLPRSLPESSAPFLSILIYGANWDEGVAE